MSKRLARKLDPKRVALARLNAMSPALGEVAPDETDVTPKASPEALRAAAEKFGLHVAPPSGGTSGEPKMRRPLPTVTGNPAAEARERLAIRPPSAWEAELRAMSPKSSAHSWLRFAWMETPREAAGFRPDEGRWVLYECVPNEMISADRRFQLQVPYWEMPATQRMGRQQMVSAYQFVLYQQEGVDARPFWVIQGNHGGHPAGYTDLEKRILRALHQPVNPPRRGELPYAPWDGRVRDAIERRDRLTKLSGRVEALRGTATGDAMRAEADAVEREFRKVHLAWWAEQMEPHADWLAWYTRKTESDMTLKRMSREEASRMDAALERYIETGQL